MTGGRAVRAKGSLLQVSWPLPRGNGKVKGRQDEGCVLLVTGAMAPEKGGGHPGGERQDRDVECAHTLQANWPLHGDGGKDGQPGQRCQAG